MDDLRVLEISEKCRRLTKYVDFSAELPLSIILTTIGRCLVMLGLTRRLTHRSTELLKSWVLPLGGLSVYNIISTCDIHAQEGKVSSPLNLQTST